MDWRNLRVGEILWYIDLCGPFNDGALDLCWAKVEHIDHEARYPVTVSKWNKDGKYQNYLAPENLWYQDFDNPSESQHINMSVYPRATDAIDAYVKARIAEIEEDANDLREQAMHLMANAK